MNKFLEENEIEVLDVWVAWSNTDLTEGRGQPIPLHTCRLESTARRLGKKKNVQGSDCDVFKEKALRINGNNYVRGRIELPSSADEVVDEQEKIRDEAILKAKKLGLSEEDIEVLLAG